MYKLKKRIVAFFLTVLPTLIQAQIKVEAEDYTEIKSLETEIILETENQVTSNFDEEGEEISYNVNIPESGLYLFSFKYTAGKSGLLKIVTKNKASFIYKTESIKSSKSWKELPLNQWSEFPKEEGALFYLEEGTQSFTIINMGTSLHIDHFTLTKSSTDNKVVEIGTSPSKIELMPDENIQINAYGINGKGEILAKYVEWSDNATDGVYMAGSSLGSDVITVKIEDIEKELKVSVCNPEKKQEFVVSKHGQLQVKDGTICDSSGTVVSLMGPSLFWSCSAEAWWNKETVNYLVSEYNIQIIRLPVSIAPSDGKPWDGDATWNKYNYYHRPDYTKKLVDEVMKAAIENDIYVIIDFHEHYAEHWVNLSKEFFSYVANKWGNYPNVMYEIFNEPKTDNETVINYAKEIIPVVRNIDSKNIIIVGSTQYSREPHNVTAAGIGHSNIAYTWHGYIEWGHQTDWKEHPEWATDIPIIVTEWGLNWDKNDGGLINIYKEKSLINCFWSVNNKGGDDEKWSILKSDCYKISNWADSELTENGAYLLGITKDWINYKPTAIESTKEFQLTICEGKTLTIPINETVLTGEAIGGTGEYQYRWEQISGPSKANITSTNSSTTSVTELEVGTYVFNLHASDGKDELQESVKVTILPERYMEPGLIDDFEDGDYISLWSGKWKTFDDQKQNANPHSKIETEPMDGKMKIEYKLGSQWQGNSRMNEPYCGFKLYMNEDENEENLSECTKITYRNKGASHDFQVETSEVKDGDFHSVHINSSDNWTTASIDWNILKQATDWGEDKELKKSEVVKFSWLFKGSANSSGILEIDDLLCEGMTNSISTNLTISESDDDIVIYPNPSNDRKSVIVVNKFCEVVIANLQGEVIKKFNAIPQSDNKIEFPDKGIYIVKMGTTAKKVIVK